MQISPPPPPPQIKKTTLTFYSYSLVIAQSKTLCYVVNILSLYLKKEIIM